MSIKWIISKSVISIYWQYSTCQAFSQLQSYFCSI